MPFIIDARNMGGGSIGSAAGGDTSTGTRNNVTLAAPWDENKEYLKGDLATNNGDLYQAQKSVPAGVQISDEDYWALVVAGDKSKETEQLRKDIGSLAELETESKDNLVNAINEVGSIQSDWNQNDETKKDYIKGRTHYTYKESKTLYENTAMDFTSISHIDIDGNPFLLEEGKTYIVVWDGVEYEAVCKIYPASRSPFLGNVYWGNKRPSDDTGEPFYVDDKVIYAEFGSGTHSILLMQNIEAVHTLDPKYIDDMYYTKTIPGNTLLCTFDVSEGKHTSVELAFPLVVDSEYNLTIDGDSYGGNVAIDNGTITLNCAHGVLTVEPHNPLLGRWDGNPLKHHIEIAEYNHKIIHQIDPKYIPNQNTVFEARLFQNPSIPTKLTLESGVTTNDLTAAFKSGKHVLAHVYRGEHIVASFEMQAYNENSSGVVDYIRFEPVMRIDLDEAESAYAGGWAVLHFENDSWYLNTVGLGTSNDSIRNVPLEVNVSGCKTIDELMAMTSGGQCLGYIADGNLKLYLQFDAWPGLHFVGTAGVCAQDAENTSAAIDVRVERVVPVSDGGEINWDSAEMLPVTPITYLTKYFAKKNASGTIDIFDVMGQKVEVGKVDTNAIISYNHTLYYPRGIGGTSTSFYAVYIENYMLVSTITVNYRYNYITVTDFQPLWEIATESEVNNAVDDIFKTI